MNTEITQPLVDSNSTELIVKIYPKGHLLSMSILYGFLFSMGLGLTLYCLLNIYLIVEVALPLGLMAGGLTGLIIEKRLTKTGRIRPMSKEERKVEAFFITLGLMLIMASLLIFLYLLPRIKN